MFIEIWTISTKFPIYVLHKNNIGSEVDEKLHAHVFSVEIIGESQILNKSSIVFNFKTIASFVFNLLNDKNLNELLEHREKYIDKKYLKYVKDISNEPSNEVIQQFVGRLVNTKILFENPEMKGIHINVIFRKKDGIDENKVIGSPILELTAETTCEYSCKRKEKKV